MPITAQQKIERRKHLGSSDIAAILGLDPYRTAHDVYLEKAGKLIDDTDEDLSGADVKYIGNRLEESVLGFAADRLGRDLEYNCTAVVPGTPIVVNTDAITCSQDPEPVEAKTSGIVAKTPEWWGEDGSDQVPDRVIVQAHAHMMAWNSSVCHIPALIGGRGFALFRVPRNPKIVDAIGARAIEFWDQHVQADIPPTNSSASLQIVKLVRRQPEKIAAVDPALLQQWLEAREAEKVAEKAADAAQAALLTALGDAEAGLCGDLGAVTFFEQTRKEYVCKASTFRVLRHKPKGL